MPDYTLPNTQTGGSQTVSGSSLSDAESKASSAGTWSPAAGTYGNNSLPGGGGDSGGGGGGGGGGGSSSGSQTGANVAAGQMLLNSAQQAAYQAYLNAKLQLDTDTEAYQKAAQEAATAIAQAGVTGTYNGMPTQDAIKQAADIAAQQANTMLSYASQFGVWGTPQQGQQTLVAQQQAFSQAQQAAQLTGWYTPYTYSPPQGGTPGTGVGFSTVGAGQPGGPPVPGAAPTGAGGGTTAANLAQSTYPPGTFLRDASGSLIAQVQPDGTLRPFSSWQEYLAAGGQSDALGQATGVTQVPTATLNQMLSLQAPAPAGAATAGGAASAAGQTIPQASATLGTPPGYQAGQPIQTLAANEQAYSQWLRSQQQADVEWQQQQTAAQNYLTMMSQLRGPADWAQYQKVLGATPGGMKDLVSAAAGQYIPGGGATTGVQPQAASLNSFVGSATGTPDTSSQAALNSLVAPNQMAPQTWNALTTSQQQMLLGVWESQGYSQDDAKALFNQSLPKYATSGPSSGSFRLQ